MHEPSVVSKLAEQAKHHRDMNAPLYLEFRQGMPELPFPPMPDPSCLPVGRPWLLEEKMVWDAMVDNWLHDVAQYAERRSYQLRRGAPRRPPSLGLSNAQISPSSADAKAAALADYDTKAHG